MVFDNTYSPVTYLYVSYAWRFRDSASLCYSQAHCKPIVLQNQHRIDHGDALVSSPTPCISFFKPFRLFYYLNCGRVESIVENKHGEWMLMQGLVCFFSSHQVTFQSCYVRFTPFAISFDFFFFFLEQQF